MNIAVLSQHTSCTAQYSHAWEDMSILHMLQTIKDVCQAHMSQLSSDTLCLLFMVLYN